MSAGGGYAPRNGAHNVYNSAPRPAGDGSLGLGVSKTKDPYLNSQKLMLLIIPFFSISLISQDDFPQLCETCLGQNPYVRMVKLPFGHKLCKISNAPYQAFRWKAGPQGRYKETIISYVVACEKNICQACLNDMKYGIPVGVRDRILSQASSHNAITNGGDGDGTGYEAPAMPNSLVGQRYYYEQQEALIHSGGGGGGGMDGGTMSEGLHNIAAVRQLDKFSRTLQAAEAKNKIAFRNLPKLCSFWLNGTCNRVIRKTCPFRPCCGEDAFAFPEIAGSHRELCLKLVAELKEKGPAEVMKTLDSETKEAFRSSVKGNKDDAMRRRVSGEDDLTKKYLGKMKSMHLELPLPQDQTITTLWLGNVEADITEADIREAIYAYGQIIGMHMVRNAKCCFVEFASRQMAEYAASQLYNALVVKGRALSVNWARPRAQAVIEGAALNDGANTSREVVMLAPPGMEKAPKSAYSLEGMGQPILPGPGTQQGTEGSVTLSTSRQSRPRDDDVDEHSSKRPHIDHASAKPISYPSMSSSRLGADLHKAKNA